MERKRNRNRNWKEKKMTMRTSVIIHGKVMNGILCSDVFSSSQIKGRTYDQWMDGIFWNSLAESIGGDSSQDFTAPACLASCQDTSTDKVSAPADSYIRSRSRHRLYLYISSSSHLLLLRQISLFQLQLLRINNYSTQHQYSTAIMQIFVKTCKFDPISCWAISSAPSSPPHITTSPIFVALSTTMKALLLIFLLQ